MPVTWWSLSGFGSGGEVQLEACIAAIDGGGLLALAPLRFSVVLPGSNDIVEANKRRTTLTGNVAGSSGGAIATWAPISVEFGYRLVRIDVSAISDVGIISEHFYTQHLYLDLLES